MTRRRTAILALTLVVAVPARAADIDVCFVPGEDCAARIVAVLDGATRTLLVQQYELTAPALIEAVLAAHRRGVIVRVILDKSQRSSRHSAADFLATQGVPIAIDQVSGIAHNKIAIVDGETVVGGSYNWTRSAATRNVENVTIIRDRAVAAASAANFARRAAVAAAYRKRGGEE